MEFICEANINDHERGITFSIDGTYWQRNKVTDGVCNVKQDRQSVSGTAFVKVNFSLNIIDGIRDGSIISCAYFNSSADIHENRNHCYELALAPSVVPRPEVNKDLESMYMLIISYIIVHGLLMLMG